MRQRCLVAVIFAKVSMAASTNTSNHIDNQVHIILPQGP